jgi:hypothetical protein
MTITTKSLINAVKYARNTGYFLHDIRDPDFYENDQTEQIKEIDKAFMDSANSLNMTFIEFAGYGESGEALDAADNLTDDLLSIGATGNEFKIKNIYDVTYSFFRVTMKKWLENMTQVKLNKLNDYWGQYAA